MGDPRGFLKVIRERPARRPALERLDACPADTVLVTDTIPRHGPVPKNLHVVSVAPLLARAIQHLHESKSLSVLFDSLDG